MCIYNIYIYTKEIVASISYLIYGKNFYFKNNPNHNMIEGFILLLKFRLMNTYCVKTMPFYF